MTYRPDIDGLRAIAVMAVTLFHLNVAGLAGGYVGVDIFFVISGFLITRLIVDEVKSTGGFSFKNFYLRRARRLFPALFFIVFVTFCFAAFVFIPPHLERLGGATIHTLLSTSNFFFWREAGYFDTSAEFKPLLHTWSLGVEEQFYVVWPLLIVIAMCKSPRYGAVAAIVGIGLFSFLLNAMFYDGDVGILRAAAPKIAEWFSDGSSTIFYLAPFRVFEFAIGAALVWVARIQPKNKLLLEPLAALGLGMVAWSICTYSEGIIFPYYNALLPCLGAALLIYAGQARYTGRILNNPVAVWTGKISYSLYLIHWPLIVFTIYRIDDISNPWVVTTLLLLMFAGASLMYKFIEQPFRRTSRTLSDKESDFGLACALFALVLVLPASNAWANSGWLWRMPEQIRMALGNNWENQSAATQQLARKAVADKGKNPGDNYVLLVGDSYMGDLFGAVSEPLKKSGFTVGAQYFDDSCMQHLNKNPYPRAALMTKLCQRDSKRLNDLRTKIAAAKYIILDNRWVMETIKDIDEFYEWCKIANPECNLFIVSRKVEWKDLPLVAARSFTNFNRGRVNAAAYSARLAGKVDPVNKALERKAKALGVHYIDINDFVCDDDAQTCDVIDQQSRLLVYDHGHWSTYGQSYFSDKIELSEVLLKTRPLSKSAP
ncbi:acyltransferase family protein [Marinicaulis aureus]|uniref:Acyltransferase family protein n=1 Tax=Hyphococcus aureus TaxID=2666033 RepID=A0ABW1KYS5_9PROT